MKNRMLLLAKADFTENKRLHLTLLLSVILIFFITFAYINSGDINPKWRNDFFTRSYLYTQMMAITVCCTILTMSFRNHHKRGRSIIEAMLPVGENTKFLYIFLKQWLFLPSVVFVLMLINVYIWSLILGYDGNWDFLYGIFSLNEILMLVIIAGVAFLSSIIFKRFQITYTFITLLILWLILFISRIKFSDSVTQTIITLIIIAALILTTFIRFKYLQIRQ